MKKIIVSLIAVLLTASMLADGVAKPFFENSSITRNANVGVLIVDAATGETIDAYRANNLLPTASTMKVISTATALELLGGDWQWSTYLETDGRIANGVLHGNLYVRGTGDPTLGSADIGDRQFMQKWVKELQKMGIRKIDGAVIADMTMFDNGDATNPGWLWGDMGNYYGMGIFSLNYMDNTMNVVLRSREMGSIAEVISTYPEVPGVQFENHIRCTDITYDGAYIHGAAFVNKRVLTGSVPANLGSFGVRGDIPNPGLLLVQHLDKELNHSGITTTAKPSFITMGKKQSRTLLYEHKSPLLREVVKETNIHSNNLFAESIFRTLGMQKGTPATILQSLSVVEQCWRQRGVEWGTTIQDDGCGLAPQNGVSPATFVSLLRYMYTAPTYDDLYASLPVSGESGTLRGFLRDTRLHGKVHAKSGSIAHLKSYTGYIHRPDGHTWIFSIVVSNGNGSGRVVQKEIERYLLEVTK